MILQLVDLQVLCIIRTVLGAVFVSYLLLLVVPNSVLASICTAVSSVTNSHARLALFSV